MAQGRLNEETSIQSPKLDLRDTKILSVLSVNSRVPVSELAKKLRVNRDTVTYKIKRMQKLGVIYKFYAEINMEMFGYRTYHVFMLIDELDSSKRDLLIKELVEHPNTKSLIEYNDKWDFEWVLVSKTIEDFENILSDIASKHKEIIVEKDSLLVSKYFFTTNLPYPYYKDLGYSVKKDIKTNTSVKVDNKDMEILSILSKDTRINCVEIGNKINLGPDSVIRRINKLIESDIITKFTILADMNKLKLGWNTFAIHLKYFDKKNQSKLCEYVREHPYILRCVKTLGVWNILVYISTDNSMNLHKTIKDMKKEFSNIILNYQTLVAFKEHCYFNFPKIVRGSKD